jgi:hypothetical protein
MKKPLAILSAALLSATPVLAQQKFPDEIPPPEIKQPKPIEKRTLNDLPPTGTSGSFVLKEPTVKRNIGYNPSRSWEANTKASEIITLGDVSTSSGKNVTLRDLAPYTGRKLSDIRLSEVGPLSGATLEDLVRAYPELGNKRVNQVPLLNSGKSKADTLEDLVGPKEADAIRDFAAKNPFLDDLPLGRIAKGKWDAILEGGAQIALLELSRKYPVLGDIRLKDLKSVEGLARTGLRLYDRFSNGTTIAEAVRNEPALKQIPLGILFDLDKEGVEAIPGIENVALNNIEGGQDALVERIPGMKNVPIDVLFGNQLSNVQFAQFDVAQSGDEIAPEVLSGETPLNKFRIKACSSSKPGGCSNIELVKLSGWPLPGVHGKRWVEGSDQIVDGCINSLCSVANKEQTGIKYNDALNWKAVLMKVDEGGGGKPATATFGVSFQLRYRDISGTPHASSHFIGPFPVYTVGVKAAIPVAADLSPDQLFGDGGTSSEVPSQFANQVALQTPGDYSGGAGAPPVPGTYQNPSPGAVFYTHKNVFWAFRSRCGGNCHPGLDLFSSGANPTIRALEDGTFVSARYDAKCGTAVVSHYPKGKVKMRNHHTSGALVKPNQRITRGQHIAKEGAPNQGCGSGRHNHWEMYKNFSTLVNPACYKYDPPLPQKATQDGSSLWRFSNKC